MKKTTLIILAALIGLGVYLIITPSKSSPEASAALAGKQVTLYKSPNCGCCGNYVSYLRRHGLQVEKNNIDDMDAIKDEHHVPHDQQSCHTALVDGYVIEGHVPIEAIVKLFQEKPNVRGIALPGMPSGAPGMPGMHSEFLIRSFDDKGDTMHFMTM